MTSGDTNSFLEEFYHRGVIQSKLERALGQHTINWLSAILAGLLLPGSSALPTTMTPGVCACHSDL